MTSSVTDDPRELIRAYFCAVDANDVDRVLELFHEDIVYERPGYDAISGKDRLRHFFAEERIIAAGRHDIEGLLVDGEHVAAWGSFVGTSRTGADLSESFCDVYQMRDRTIYRRRTFFFRPAV